MPSQINNFFTSQRFKQLVDVRNIGLYAFAVIVLAIAWSGARTVQSNYELQKQISVLNQQNSLLQLENETIELQNKYFESDHYLELSARQNLGLAAPGEKIVLVPKSVAMKYIDPELAKEAARNEAAEAEDMPRYRKNLEDWRNFLLGRKLFDE